jgi:hypothetical protein
VFSTSKHNTPSVAQLLKIVKHECTEIMSSKLVPSSYVYILSAIQEQTKSLHRPIIRFKEVKITAIHLDSALKYWHSVGRIVLVDDLICTDPAFISQLMSNFISPESVQLLLPHLANKKIEILTSQQVGKLMTVKGDDSEYDHFFSCFLHASFFFLV